jgi:hypothetical protein
MKKIILFVPVLLLCFISFPSSAATNLASLMGSSCEKLGPTEGANCIQVQRRMEQQNDYLDENSASVCSMIWKWGSQGNDNVLAGRLVVSCFQRIANLKISAEVKDTCDHRISANSPFGPSAAVIKKRVEKMMACIKDLAIPFKAQL